MLFNSIQFLIFFPLVTILYFLLPYKFRIPLLLVSSCIFYMAFIPVYILVLAITILIDYFAGMQIEKSAGIKKKILLWVSIISTCLVLFVFKYLDFFYTSITSYFDFLDISYSKNVINIILPIGLSFHTFQSLSYVIEVYKGNQKAEKNFLTYALYVMFYPQLVAGPIERPQNLLHQFKEKHKFEYTRVTDGLKLMAWGMFKKVVIADRLAVIVNRVYDTPMEFNGIAFIIATVFFAFQIYCDFSGYSDIAIGAAQVMGFRLMDNFKRPYFSNSISIFWTRWHISLSTWFKDYLYISLGGNRVSRFRWQFNLFFTFLISGLWHGANWTFVIWGALNGFYLVFAIWTKNIRTRIAELTRLSKFPKILKIWQVSATFSLICFSWIFFRANNVTDAFYISSHLFTGFDKLFDYGYIKNVIADSGLGLKDFLFALLLIFVLECIHLIQRHNGIRHMLKQKPLLIRWSIYYFIILSIVFFGIYEKNEFIYFQF